MARTHNAEMATVESGDAGDPKALSDDDQAAIRATQTKIGIALDQLGDAPSVGGRASLFSAEALGEQLVGVTGKAAGPGRAQPYEREGVLHGQGLRRQRCGQLRNHQVDADSSSRRLSLQTRERVLW